MSRISFSKIAKDKMPHIRVRHKIKRFKYFRRKSPRISHISIKFQKIEKIETLKTTSKRFQTRGEKNNEGKKPN